MAEGNFSLKLSDGSDILAGIRKLAEEKGIAYGFIETGIGKIRDFELVSSGPHGSMDSMSSKEDFQVNALSGKVQRVSGEEKFNVNLRVSITKTGFTPKAGQLLKGKASGLLEIGVRKVDLKKIIYA